MSTSFDLPPPPFFWGGKGCFALVYEGKTPSLPNGSLDLDGATDMGIAQLGSRQQGLVDFLFLAAGLDGPPSMKRRGGVLICSCPVGYCRLSEVELLAESNMQSASQSKPGQAMRERALKKKLPTRRMMGLSARCLT